MENREVFNSKKYGQIEILKYETWDNVLCRFLKTGYTTKATIADLRNDFVKDRLSPTVYGVGTLGDKPTKVDKIHLRQYVFWVGMLKRCYGTSFKKKYDTYVSCEASENFKDYSFFSSWCEQQKGFGNEGWHLDKDILIRGNKVYSEDTCCFVPREINQVFCKANKVRGKCLIGVSKVNGRYLAQVSVFGVNKKLGYFDTELEAFAAYKQSKEVYIKQLAEKFKDSIDTRVYNALVSYTVEITD